MNPRTTWAALIAASLWATSARAVIHVDSSATGLNDGTSWQDAFTDLQDALASVQTNNETIRIAQGTYVPGTTRTASFSVPSAFIVIIQGGYAGLGASGVDPDTRNPEIYPTILSGELQGDAIPTNNAYHVVVLHGTHAQSEIDGCIIEAGHADGAASIDRSGAGMRIGRVTSGSGATRGTIRNCTIRNCSAAADGGGALVTGEFAEATPIFRFTSFRQNSAEGEGGGLKIEFDDPALLACDVAENSAGVWGGGLAVHEGEPRLVSTTLRANVAPIGGGIARTAGPAGNASPQTILNCLITDNAAEIGGGAFATKAIFDFLNCTIADNLATAQGSAVYVSSHLTHEMLLRNSIVWGNRTNQSAADQVVVQDAQLAVTHCDIEGGCLGGIDIPLADLTCVDAPTGSVIDDDPLFAGSGSYRLAAASPARDTGSDPAVAPWLDDLDVDEDGNFTEVTPDLDLGLRQRSVVDMGAYEHNDDCAADLNGDQIVGFGDLTILLAPWGPCPPAGGCPADLNQDGIVGFADLVILLANWGPCNAPTPTAAPQSIQDCIAKVGLDPEKLADCIEAMILAGTP